MTRFGATVLAVVLVLSTVAVTLPAGAATAFFGVTDVTVSPSTPAPGEAARVSITVTNFQNSPGTIEITDIAIRNSPGDAFREYARIEDVGKLAPGASLTIPLTHRFDSAGLHDLRIHVWVRTPSGREHITYPLTVRVRSEHPAIGLQDARFIASTTQEANVTITNGLDSTVRDVSIRLAGDDVTGERETTVATIASGASRGISFDFTPKAAGDRTVTAVLSYTTDAGTRRTVNETITYRVDPLETGVALDTERVGGGSSVQVTVTNLGNVPAKRLLVTGTIDGRTVDRAALGTLATDESRTISLNASGLTGRSEMQVEASYTQAGDRGRETATAVVSGNPATVELTGINVEVDDGKIHITGSTSNIGLTPASSVVVRVLAADGVEPAYPGRNYFVGTVPPSDFVSFEVYASVTENATEIPLEVAYLRDGIQEKATVMVPLESTPSEPGRTPQSGGPDLPVIVGGAVVVLLVAALIGMGWRNYRAGP